VGAIIMACVNVSCFIILSANGTPKAAVFHVPVAACHIRFFSHFNKIGITFSCIGEGVSNHFFSNNFKVFSEIQSVLNFSKFVKINVC
jgi:hypothetical protein